MSKCDIHGIQFCLHCDPEQPGPVRCQVFGCTIPRGIPHEHPAGVSAVMRDPGAPLTDIERAEQQYHRQQAADHNDKAFQAMIDASTAPETIEVNQEVLSKYRVHESMLPGRKLRDSLLMAGQNDQLPVGQAPGNAFYDEMAQRHDQHGITVSDCTEVRRLSVAQIAGRIATGIVLAVGVASILILSAMTAGWL